MIAVGCIVIADSLGAPIETYGGMYARFNGVDRRTSKAARPDADGEKSKFMEDYRLLPCDAGGLAPPFTCTDAREFDAIRSVIDTCARLAVLGGYGNVKSERVPNESDAGKIEGFEVAEGGGFLRVDLRESRWYRRFLFSDLFSAKVSAAGGAGFFHRFHAPSVGGRGPYQAIPGIDIDGGYPGGTFVFCDDDAESERRGLDTGHFMCKKSHELRRDFLGFAEGGAWSDVVFWSDSEMIVRAKGESIGEVAASMADALLDLHTRKLESFFNFAAGYWIAAPIGLSALWADFALSIANRKITVCDYCGFPIIAEKSSRRIPRRYCNDNCRKKSNRRR